MRRWNGWGDDAVDVPLRPEALAFLARVIAPPSAPRDATYQQALSVVAALPSRLPAHPLIDTTPAARLAASFGQSLGDWLRLRFGALGRVTDGVAFPEHAAQVRELLDWARQVGVRVLPCGGATSVVGHLTPVGDRPVLTLNLTRMMRLLALDTQAQLASFEAGVNGPDLEAQLRAHGYTLGHFPQSFEYSTLGGWVATRSSGQQSAHYGRIEQMLAGATVVTPTGTLHIPTFPASAAGPDLREWLLGSEGRLGVITEATVRITRAPERERFVGVFFPTWGHAAAAVREIAQARAGVSMLRLANATETATMLAMAGRARAIGWLERWLRWRGASDGKCLLLVGDPGNATQIDAINQVVAPLLARQGGVTTGTAFGHAWVAQRFRGVYLRNSLWHAGYAVETIETACDWPKVDAMVAAMEGAGRAALAAHGERVHCYTHLSHVYPQGSSVYSTFVFRIGNAFDDAYSRYRALKDAVSAAIVEHSGTISHQHGVGKDHAPWLAAEKSAAGIDALRALIRHFDPHGVMACGNLVDDAA
jgi:alkyldihydroxyacetonephosphate synthase